METVASVDQVRANLDAIAVPAHRAFENAGDVELFRNLARVQVLAFERKRRRARDHAQTAGPGQSIENFLADAVAKVFLIARPTKIGKWQYRDAFFRRRQ